MDIFLCACSFGDSPFACSGIAGLHGVALQLAGMKFTIVTSTFAYHWRAGYCYPSQQFAETPSRGMLLNDMRRAAAGFVRKLYEP